MCAWLAVPGLGNAVLLQDLRECALAGGERFDGGLDAVGGPDHQATLAA